MGDEAYVRVPVSVYKWLMGEEGDFEPPPTGPHSRRSMFWWRSEFERRIKLAQSTVPPAMQRASSEAQFNVVGDELRKISAWMEEILVWRRGSDDRLSRMEDRMYRVEESLITRVEQNQQLIMQKLGGIAEEHANHYGAIHTKFIHVYDRINDAIEALETLVKMTVTTKRNERELDADELEHLAFIKEAALGKRARKRQPKPVRPASKRKSTRKL